MLIQFCLVGVIPIQAQSDSADMATKESATINLEAPPFVPRGWTVEEHRGTGELLVRDIPKIRLFTAETQKGPGIGGAVLRKELAEKPVLNANVLDFLLKNPDLIPNEWQNSQVYFWGTVYRGKDGFVRIRMLHWDGRGWQEGFGMFGVFWFWNDQAALAPAA
ncbi:MAG: hypothetical protein WCJ29_05920 [bacterium]